MTLLVMHALMTVHINVGERAIILRKKSSVTGDTLPFEALKGVTKLT
jgi:hypothetical protein